MIRNIPIALFEQEVSEERRTELARKGLRLYAKYCSLRGCGICAESFAEYHIARGESIIARDFLDYLNGQLAQLSAVEHGFERAITEQLIAAIEARLGVTAVQPA